MRTFFFMRAGGILLLILTLTATGCASFSTDQQKPPAKPDPFGQSRVIPLLAFGANMATLSRDSQSELCKSILETPQTQTPSDDTPLRLMVGRLLSASCGDIPKILEDIEAIRSRYISDDYLQRFITLQVQVLAHMHTQSVKLDIVEHDQKKVKSLLNTKGEKKKENNLLREKLEAIRSMEKQLDESSNNN